MNQQSRLDTTSEVTNDWHPPEAHLITDSQALPEHQGRLPGDAGLPGGVIAWAFFGSVRQT